MIHPALWNACDFVLQYNFVIAHVPGAMNSAADYLSRAEIKATEKLEMTIRNDISIQTVDVHIQSKGITEEETVYVVPEEATKEEMWEHKRKLNERAKNSVEQDEIVVMLFQKCNNITIPSGNTYGHFRNNARMRLE